ncbi:MAG: tRNA (adenosine(37)-N6)-threonylcarbamoyltransferase complex ATPase subunit type 1 TsaE [Alphaproteobacteria bacterium]|nr:tRNA (adenosine(37)-N6)-threonylcarbamoyltransferase complex ATPase subunit type 1 TsaE [Alphaproteobacteria bacterium]HCP01025.1 tRNA (adenosine(37)-N6)-threonylcarbamoyltransferase complex ATPase subunit type 1 TsaE [Rhodospirillaceae bacterium]
MTGRQPAVEPGVCILRYPLPGPTATTNLGAALAPRLGRGDVLTLAGDLGAGKTTLARGLIGALGHAGPVPSPTFTLVQHYAIEPVPIWHFDLYRIGHRDELVELGYDEACAEGIVLVEWADRLGPDLPATRLNIALDYDRSGRARAAKLSGLATWTDRLQGFWP